jgi:hypothetical protein
MQRENLSSQTSRPFSFPFFFYFLLSWRRREEADFSLFSVLAADKPN